MIKQGRRLQQWWQQRDAIFRAWPLDALSPLCYVPDAVSGESDEISADLLLLSVETAH